MSAVSVYRSAQHLLQLYYMYVPNVLHTRCNEVHMWQMYVIRHRYEIDQLRSAGEVLNQPKSFNTFGATGRYRNMVDMLHIASTTYMYTAIMPVSFQTPKNN